MTPSRRGGTRQLVAGAFIGLALWGGLSAFRNRGEPPAELRAGVPVIVELFSAEGCSSCPPADEYVAGLDRMQPIDGVAVIALELHVDYWDRLGWKDPYGSPAFTERQREYARVLEDHRTFTPEIVIDGNKLMPGGDEERARALMLESAREVKARVSLERTARGRFTIVATDVPAATDGASIEAWFVVTESHLDSDVSAGENRGRVLSHAPIVRELRRLARVEAGVFRAEVAVDIDLGWRPRALRFVAFLQDILGASAI